MIKLSISILAVFLLIIGLTAVGSAQSEGLDSISDDQVNRVARQLYCPVCENIPLDVCPTQACAEWREMIREKLAEGWSEIQVTNYFVDQYGDRVLGAPPARGLNWLVYVLPPLVILLGAIFLVRSLILWQRRSKAAPAAMPGSNQAGKPAAGDLNPSAGQEEYIRQIEEELKKR